MTKCWTMFLSNKVLQISQYYVQLLSTRSADSFVTIRCVSVCLRACVGARAYEGVRENVWVRGERDGRFCGIPFILCVCIKYKHSDIDVTTESRRWTIYILTIWKSYFLVNKRSPCDLVMLRWYRGMSQNLSSQSTKGLLQISAEGLTEFSLRTCSRFVTWDSHVCLLVKRK